MTIYFSNNVLFFKRFFILYTCLRKVVKRQPLSLLRSYKCLSLANMPTKLKVNEATTILSV